MFNYTVIDVKDNDIDGADVSQVIGDFYIDHVLPVNSNLSTRRRSSHGTMATINYVITAQN